MASPGTSDNPNTKINMIPLHCLGSQEVLVTAEKPAIMRSEQSTIGTI